MIKQKIAAIAASALAACATIGATAFATTTGVPKYDFGPITLTAGGNAYNMAARVKEDDSPAWVRVYTGPASGNTYVTFQVLTADGSIATDAVNLYANGEYYIPYRAGQGIKGKSYFLRFYMEPQSGANSMYISGIWAP